MRHGLVVYQLEELFDLGLGHLSHFRINDAEELQKSQKQNLRQPCVSRRVVQLVKLRFNRDGKAWNKEGEITEPLLSRKSASSPIRGKACRSSHDSIHELLSCSSSRLTGVLGGSRCSDFALNDVALLDFDIRIIST